MKVTRGLGPGFVVGFGSTASSSGFIGGMSSAASGGLMAWAFIKWLDRNGVTNAAVVET